MSVTSVHPQFAKFKPLWIKMLDCFKGADHIKAEGVTYLPAHPSMEYDGMGLNQDGWKRYQAYKTRAKFPEYVNDGVLNHGGVLHRKEAVIQLPDGMEFLRTRATSKGEGLNQLLRRINELQLRDGRLGLLVELPAGVTQGTMPYIAVYEALAVRNWDDGTDDLGTTNLNLVVLDESKDVLNKSNMNWTWKMQYRVLALGSLEDDEPDNSGAKYKQWMTEVISDDGEASNEVKGTEVQPAYAGKDLEVIPFVFCNAMDLVAEPDRPPLLTLANAALSIYQGEADYRQTLFMQGQDTLVVRGGLTNGNQVDDKAPIRVGAGARIDTQGDTGDAKYIGVSSNGLPEQRKALESDHADARSRAGSLTNTDTASQESGDALRTRLASKTASLVGIAHTGAAALESVLRMMAEWMGLNPDEVKVTPNLDFSKSVMLGQDFVQIMTARGLAAPLSLESIHGWLEDNGMTSLSFEDEMKKVEEESVKYKALFESMQKADQNGQQQVSGKNTDAVKTPPK